MCRPQYFSVSYRINPWMEPDKNPSNWNKAFKQWSELHHTIIRLGGWVDYIDPQPGLPDMVFTANHALVYNNKIIVAKFRHRERQVESLFVKRWFEDKGDLFDIISMESHDFEGAGDALFAGDTLFCGYGIRTNFKAYRSIVTYLDVKNYVFCRLVDDYFYHLDTCFCPLDENNALIYPKAFDKASLARMENEINLHPVPKKDARKFACNAIVLDKDVIIPAGCEDTEKILLKIGCQPHSIEMSEYIKSGGACKCCTLKLWESIDGTFDYPTC